MGARRGWWSFSFCCPVAFRRLAAHLLSNHYNLTRDGVLSFNSTLSSKTNGDIIPFIKYALEGFVDGLNEQILTFKFHQLEVHIGSTMSTVLFRR